MEECIRSKATRFRSYLQQMKNNSGLPHYMVYQNNEVTGSTHIANCFADFFKSIKMLYFALRAFGFLITNINIKITIYCSPSLLSFSILSLLFLILSSISLPSSLHISPHSLLILSLISPHVFDFLTVLAVTACTFSLSSPSFPFLFSLSSSPPLQPAIIFLSHTHSLPSILYFDSLILSLLSYLSVSLSLYLFIHLLLVHFLAGSSSYSLLFSSKFSSVSPVSRPI
jgi:hypothetical protein